VALQSEEDVVEEAETNGRQSSPEASAEVLVAHKVRLNNRASSYTYGLSLVPAACESRGLVRSCSKPGQWAPGARDKACKVRRRVMGALLCFGCTVLAYFFHLFYLFSSFNCRSLIILC
jgi:hypothetical protein